jgi:hypothetical protein
MSLTATAVPYSSLVLVAAHAVHFVFDKEKGSHCFVIRVSDARDSWIIQKRYSQFEELVSKLARVHGAAALKDMPALPPKASKVWTAHDDKFLEERRALLDNWLERLLLDSELRASQLVVNFLNADRVDGMDLPVPEECKSSVLSVSVSVEPLDKSGVVFYRVACKSTDSITGGIRDTNVLRRFRDVVELREKLSARLRESAGKDKEAKNKVEHMVSEFPPLPPKLSKIWHNHRDPELLETRKALIQNFCRRLNRMPEVCEMDLFVQFLGVEV